MLMAFTFLSGCKKSTPPPEETSSKTKRTVPGQTETTKLETALGKSDFQEGVKLQAAGEAINGKVGHFVPNVTDWNNDGKKDLVVGEFSQGAITLYLNTGTDAAPVLDKGTILQAGDKPIRLEAG